MIRPYRYSDQAKESFDEPYLAKYAKRDKSLWYVAADHTDLVESSTFKTVSAAFEALKPQAVVIEGVEYTGAFSPEDHANHVRRCAQDKFLGCSESGYAAWLALQNNIPFIPGEPMDKHIAIELEKQGYRPVDYYYFDLARVIPQWRRTGKVKSLAGFKERAPKFIRGYFDNFDKSGRFSFDDFRRWYLLRAGQEFRFERGNSEDFSPQIDRNPTWLNKMAHSVGMIREKHILEMIELSLNQFDRTLVVYGASHLVKSRDALRQLLGTSEEVKLF